MKSFREFNEERSAKKARKGAKPEEQVKKEIDKKEFSSGKISAADKHSSEKANQKKWPKGSSFSSYRMKGSRGRGSEYEVNPRISYRRNEQKEHDDQEENFAEEYKDLTPKKEKRVEKRVGELARNVQLKAARVKELRKKPLAKFRSGVKSEIKANVKSAKKDAKLVRNASDALIRTSVDRESKLMKSKIDKEKELRDLQGEDS